MKRIALLAGLTTILVAHSTWVVLTQAPRQGVRAQKVKGDLYMLTGEGGNVAAYVTGEGVILVDDMYYRNHDAIMSQLQQLSDRPLKYVFNTHQHDDHAGGDAKMLPLAEVIAHTNARANLITKKQPFFEETPGTPIGLPRVTFSDETSVFLGGKEVRASYFGRGHTNGDAVISFPELGVVHTGDLFLSTRPAPGRAGAPAAADRPVSVPIFVDYSQGGSFLDWTGTLDRLLKLDFDTVIPGHGPLSTRAELVKFRADLETMRNRIQGFIRGGKSRDEMVKILETDYSWRATGCPPSPPRAGCLQYQQVDALIAELR
jgi:glyoxylase-like metal-dependent hydrolase (beta-lactamase superfamily II)